MNKNAIVFLCTFAAGCVVALAVRSAIHEPYAASTSETAPAVTPATGHDHSEAAPAAEEKPVNTVCAICGMKVNPKIPTAMYQGKVIGFGCKKCPPKFAANPALYGPAALANKVVE